MILFQTSYEEKNHNVRQIFRLFSFRNGQMV